LQGCHAYGIACKNDLKTLKDLVAHASLLRF
jgi:hypothetical protein